MGRVIDGTTARGRVHHTTARTGSSRTIRTGITTRVTGTVVAIAPISVIRQITVDSEMTTNRTVGNQRPARI